MNDNNEEQVKVARKAMLFGFLTYLVALFLAQWYATQSVAEQCEYNHLLGSYLEVGSLKLYFPFMYYIWSNNPEISSAIPAILSPYSSMYMFCAMLGFGVFYFMKKSGKVATEHGSASFATAKDIVDSGLGDTVEVENPADILRNQMWQDVHNIEEAFFIINNLPESTAKEKSIKHKRWENYWLYIKKSRPEDTAAQKAWDWEHNIEDYQKYAESLPAGEQKDKIETRILEILEERDHLLTDAERAEWDMFHNLKSYQSAANDYKDSKMKRQVWSDTITFIQKNRPKGSKEQQDWDSAHNINRIINKIKAILEEIDTYIADNRPKPETEEEIRRFAISKHPKPTKKQVEWDMYHNLPDFIASIKSNKAYSDDTKRQKLAQVQAFIQENQPEKGTEEYSLWLRHHTLNLSKKQYNDKLAKWQAFISKGCPKPKKIKQPKNSGVVCGINPYTHKLMLHDGVEHILLMAPTRSGKGVGVIVPTGVIWKHSIFFFDPKGELWGLTSGYRKHVLRQKVLKFQPLCKDGSAARWNPLAEINYRSFEELSDVQSITGVMVRPDGESKGGDDFWPNSAQALLNGVILHLLYKHDKEGLPLPCATDIMSFLSSPDKSTDELFQGMRDYPHITKEEFLEEPILDVDGNQQYDKNGILIRRKNPLKEIYGEYIKDFHEFTENLGVVVSSIDEIRTVIQYKIDQGENIVFESEVDGLPTGTPYHLLLTHPKVAECAANILNGAEQTRASIMQTAQTSLAIYQDPVVQANTAVSDFAIRDLLDPKQEVSLYLVMEVKDIAAVKPIARLFIQMICSKLIQDMKFGSAAQGLKKQRLLLMLDEFPQLGNMKCIELALAICAGYGIKMCIVAQDVNQLNKEYTKDNSIGSNCHLHIYYTPNIDNGGATSESISKQLGKKTIKTVSHSDGGGGFFKGSDSTSSTGRELMTPDEVSHMSKRKEIVFVAGHKPIMGDKLFFYEHDWLLQRTQIDNPPTSDSVTRIVDYKTLFEIRDAEVKSKEKDRMIVLADKARKEGITLKEYLLRDEERRIKREKDIIRKITGETTPDEEHEASNEQEINLTGTESAENESRRESAEKVEDGMESRHSVIPSSGQEDEDNHQTIDRERMMMRKLLEERERRRRMAMSNTTASTIAPNVINNEEDMQIAEQVFDSTANNTAPRKFSMDISMPTEQNLMPDSAPEEPNEPTEPEEPMAPAEEPTEPSEPMDYPTESAENLVEPDDDDIEVQEPKKDGKGVDSGLSEKDLASFFTPKDKKEE